MKSRDFLAKLREIGISRSRFERLVGFAPGSLRRYVGDTPVPSRLVVILTLMELLHQQGVDFVPHIEALCLRPMKARGRCVTGQSSYYEGDRPVASASS